MEQVSTFKKYKENLSLWQDYDGDLWVKSFNTIVARIENETNELIQIGSWLAKTQRHINYVAIEMNLKLIKQ